VCADAAAQRELIVGGLAATTSQFPFMASLQDITLLVPHFCGGVLIDAQHVLTSASCVAGRVQANLRVVLGRTTLSTSAGANYTYGVAALVLCCLHLLSSLPVAIAWPVDCAACPVSCRGVAASRASS
jgi:secreted trypsin-like serine protease